MYFIAVYEFRNKTVESNVEISRLRSQVWKQSEPGAPRRESLAESKEITANNEVKAGTSLSPVATKIVEGYFALGNDPRAVALRGKIRRGQMERRYAQFLKNVSLPPEDTERLKDLLGEKSSTASDVVLEGVSRGVNPLENSQEVLRALNAANRELDSEIKTLLGDEGARKLEEYDRTLKERNFLSDLEVSLSYQSSPLQAKQAEQLSQLFAEARVNGREIDLTKPEWSEAAGKFLDQSQMKALNEVIGQKSAERDLAKIFIGKQKKITK